MSPLELPCPRCGRLYDISHRMHGDRVWCLGCGKWFAVVMRVDSSVYLAPVAPPEWPRPAPREE